MRCSACAQRTSWVSDTAGSYAVSMPSTRSHRANRPSMASARKRSVVADAARHAKKIKVRGSVLSLFGTWRRLWRLAFVKKHPGGAKSVADHCKAGSEKGLSHLHEDLTAV